MAGKTVTAALCIIGNEILSGRTKDKNIGYLAEELTKMGITMREVRIVPDIESEIIDTVRHLSERYTYVFTSGGIGPTHDDITTECIAKAFGAELEENEEAMRRLTAHYANSGVEFNEARRKMGIIPVGAELIDNPISAAPGFILKNVHVMAGVPRIMQAMFELLKGKLEGGAKVISKTVSCTVGEGTVAGGLGEIQARYPKVDIGSYPYFRARQFGTSLVLRSTDEAKLDAAVEEVRALVRALGGEAIEPIDVEDGEVSS